MRSTAFDALLTPWRQGRNDGMAATSSDGGPTGSGPPTDQERKGLK